MQGMNEPTYFRSFSASPTDTEVSTCRIYLGCYGNNEITELLRMTADLLWIITVQGAVMNRKKCTFQPIYFVCLSKIGSVK
jgi:hypothetical protein